MQRNKKAIQSNRGKSRPQAAPLARGSKNRAQMSIGMSKLAGRYKDAICIEGSEWLGSVQITGTEAQASVNEEVYINPAEFAGSRLAAYASIYEKFLFEKLDFEFASCQPATQKGSVILAYDRDISDPTPPTGAVGVREFLAWEGTQTGNVWEHIRISCPIEQPDAGYYTNAVPGGDDRLAYQGQVYVATLSPTGLAANMPIGDLWVHYRLHLFVPQLSNALATASASGGNSPVTGAYLTDVLAAALSVANGGSAVYTGPSTPGLQVVPYSAVPNVISALKLAEGAYRYSMAVTQNTAGAVAFNAPVIQTLEPASASSPASSKYVNLWNATASGQTAISDYLLNIPRGGAYVYQTFSAATGLAATATRNFDIMKLGGYLSGGLGSIF